MASGCDQGLGALGCTTGGHDLIRVPGIIIQVARPPATEKAAVDHSLEATQHGIRLRPGDRRDLAALYRGRGRFIRRQNRFRRCDRFYWLVQPSVLHGSWDRQKRRPRVVSRLPRGSRWLPDPNLPGQTVAASGCRGSCSSCRPLSQPARRVSVAFRMRSSGPDRGVEQSYP